MARPGPRWHAHAKGRPLSKLSCKRRASHRMRQACVYPCPDRAETSVLLTIYLPAYPLQRSSPRPGPVSCFFSIRLLLLLLKSLQCSFFCLSLGLVTAGKVVTTAYNTVTPVREPEQNVGRASGGIQRHDRCCRHWWRLADCRP